MDSCVKSVGIGIGAYIAGENWKKGRRATAWKWKEGRRVDLEGQQMRRLSGFLLKK